MFNSLSYFYDFSSRTLDFYLYKASDCFVFKFKMHLKKDKCCFQVEDKSFIFFVYRHTFKSLSKAGTKSFELEMYCMVFLFKF